MASSVRSRRATSVPHGIAPPLCKGGIDGIEHGIDPTGKFLARRHAERDARLADLILGPHEALGHGRRRNEKRRSDRLCIESQNDLQNERRTDAGFDGRMR